MINDVFLVHLKLSVHDYDECYYYECHCDDGYYGYYGSDDDDDEDLLVVVLQVIHFLPNKRK